MESLGARRGAPLEIARLSESGCIGSPPIYEDPAMLSHYFQVALRSLRRHKGFAFINIAGLALGVASCLLIVLYVHDELSYDRYHDNAERIARLVRTTSALSAGPMAPALEAELPGVARAVRLEIYNEIPMRSEGGGRFEERLFFADSSIFEIFEFPFLEWDPATALAVDDGLVLTESTARKYYGDGNPIGRTLTAEIEGEEYRSRLQV